MMPHLSKIIAFLILLFHLEICYLFGTESCDVKHIDDVCKKCSTSRDGYSCGNNLCCCEGNYACCNNKSLTYIPELPSKIVAADFSHNHIQTLSVELFSNISKLSIKALKLCHNGITNIVNDCFSIFSNIELLDLGDNKEIDMGQLSNSFYGIPKDRKLTLKLDECGLDNITDNFFEGLYDSNIINISLQNNQLKTYNESHFKNLRHLITLDLSYNWIEVIINSSDGKRDGHSTIEILQLSHNNFFKFPPWFCTNEAKSLYPSLKKLHLSGNFIAFPTPLAWSCLKNLTHLFLRKNVLSVIQDNLFTGLTALQTLDVSHMVRSIKRVHPQAFNITNLRTLDFHHNHLSFQTNSEIPFEELFVYLHNLKSIDLSSNDIMMPDSSLRRMFEPLEKLERLYLDNTNLQYIPVDVLNALPNLERLSLGKNKISNIDPRAFTNVTKLKKLYLHENRIVEIEEISFPPSLTKSLEKINLADNPYSCTACKNMWFRNWIENGGVTFKGWPKYYNCHSPNCMRGISLKDYHPKPGDCKKNETALYIFVAITPVVLIAGSVAVYRGRWYLRYWIFKLRRRRKHSKNQNTETQCLLQGEVIYDAYVIYNDNDRGFIREVLLPFMEDKHGYRLCIRDREPELGAKVDIMVESIYRSNYVIAVVSSPFLKDQWCEFELSVTIDRQVELKRNYLLLLTLEDVDKSQLSKTWCVLLTKSPTAEWCDKRNDIKRKLFEHQLTTIIPSRKSNSM